ncbi:hypothetical protein C8R43DRAFT_956101 [Mycena crocata]|nr:hypothetical protein C8R43DRAFT_956101 [Mycena crocata]
MFRVILELIGKSLSLLLGFAAPERVCMLFDNLTDAFILRCIELCTGRSQTDYVFFVRSRNAACAVNRRFKSVVLAAHHLWSHVVVTQHVPVDTLRSWLGNAGGESLTVQVDFRDLATYYREGNPSERIHDYTRRILPVLLSSAYRWTSLQMDVEDPSCAALILLALRHVSIPTLQTFAMDCSLQSGGIAWFAGHATLDVIPPCRIFLDGVPFPVDLTADLDRGQRSCFRNLVDLRISGERFVLLDGLVAVLRSARSLRHLALSNVNVAEVGSLEEDITLPVLESLHVDTGSGMGMWSVIGQLDVPLLHTVDVTLQHRGFESFRHCLARRPFLFHEVSVLIVRPTAEADTRSLRLLFEHFPSTVILDLRHSCAFFSLRLVECCQIQDKFGAVLLPRLRELVLSAGDIPYAAAFVDLRMACMGRSLHRLDVYFSDADEFSAVEGCADWDFLLRNVLTKHYYRPKPIRLAKYATAEQQVVQPV